MSAGTITSYQDIVAVSEPGRVYRSLAVAREWVEHDYRGFFGVELSPGRYELHVADDNGIRPALFEETGRVPSKDWSADGANVVRAFRVPPKLYDEAKRLARKYDGSVSEVIRSALEAYVHEKAQTERADELAHDRARLITEEDDLLS